MTGRLYSAGELMQITGCQTMREYRAWLRKHRIRCIDAPAGPIVAHEAVLDAMGVAREQNRELDLDELI